MSCASFDIPQAFNICALGFYIFDVFIAYIIVKTLVF